VAVTFVFEERFIGEMYFRFCVHPKNESANKFVREIAETGMKLEMLQKMIRKNNRLTDQLETMLLVTDTYKSDSDEEEEIEDDLRELGFPFQTPEHLNHSREEKFNINRSEH